MSKTYLKSDYSNGGGSISPQFVATQAPTNPTDQQPRVAPSSAPLSPIRADRAEAKASRDLANAPLDLQFLMKGLRNAADFIKLAEETFLATFNDVEGDETTTDISTDAKDVREIAFQNFRQCFFLS